MPSAVADLGLAGLLIALPIVTAFVGWITNLVAVRMIFWPRRFVGLGPIGWQGIVYRHHRKFAGAAAELMSGELFSARDISDRISPSDLERFYEQAFDKSARPIVRACWEEVRPGLWDQLPGAVQDVVIGQVRRGGRQDVQQMFKDFQARSDDFIDLHAFTLRVLSEDDGEKLASTLKNLASQELRFIEIYGAVFGGVIGLAEVALWQALGLWWLLPLLGGVVGLVTNWLAIQMIFLPREQKRFGLVTYQGLFPSRQAEIARDYAEVAAAEIVNARNLIGMLTEGEGGEKLVRMILETLEQKFDERVEQLRRGLPVTVALTRSTLDRVKRRLVEQVVESAPELRREFEGFLDERLDVSTTIRERMSSLPKDEFERILRRYFEEDEWTLILLGGFLGGLIGLAQGVAMGLL